MQYATGIGLQLHPQFALAEQETESLCAEPASIAKNCCGACLLVGDLEGPMCSHGALSVPCIVAELGNRRPQWQVQPLLRMQERRWESWPGTVLSRFSVPYSCLLIPGASAPRWQTPTPPHHSQRSSVRIDLVCTDLPALAWLAVSSLSNPSFAQITGIPYINHSHGPHRD